MKKEAMKNEALTDSQSDTEGGINQFNFVIGESADVISQHGFREANKFIAINSAVVFKPFFYANFNLGGEAVISGMNWGADYSGEFGVNKRLSGDNHENTVTLRIIFISPIYPVKITSLHKATNPDTSFGTTVHPLLHGSAVRRCG